MNARKLALGLLLGLILTAGESTPAAAILAGQDSAALHGQVQIYVASRVIGLEDEYVCVGTLISTKWVLTAKHCITGPGGNLDNLGVLIGDRRLGQGTPRVLDSIHLHPTTDSALLELEDEVLQPSFVVRYGLGTPAVNTNVAIRGWGDTPDPVLQVATMRTADTRWGGAQEGNRLLFDDIGEGGGEEGDSGAGIYVQGAVYGILSTVDDIAGEASAVPTNDIAEWIQATSGVRPAGVGVPASSLRVMPLGDSITDGVGSTTAAGYRKPLWDRLAAGGHTIDFVGSRRVGAMADPDNEGHSGALIGDIARDATRWISTYRPNIVTLHLGTNDMDRGFQVATAPARLGALIDQVLDAAPDAAVLVADLVPSTKPEVQSRIAAFNRQIPGLIQGRQNAGKRVWHVEMSDVATADLQDSLHPNDRGYDKMSVNFARGISDVILAGWVSRPVPVPGQQSTFHIAGIDANNSMKLYTGNGAGQLGGGTSMWPAAGAWVGFKAIAAGDFNSDGRVDIAGIDANNSMKLYTGNGAGQLSGDISMGPATGGWANFKAITAGKFYSTR